MEKWSFNFSGVEDKNFDIAPGRYLAVVKNIEKKDGDEYPYLQWDLQITTGTAKGSNIRHITSFKPAALFNLRNTLIALGLAVPKAAVSIDPAKLIGRTLGIETFMKEKDGKEYANVKKVFPAKDLIKSAPPIPSVPQATQMTVDDDNDIMIMTDEDIPF